MSHVTWAEGRSAAASASALVAAILRARPGIPSAVRTESDLHVIDIPTAVGSDYAFVADISDDLSALGVWARLASDPSSHFWSRTFERWDYASFDQMLDEFTDLVVAVSSRPTRVVENNGLLSRSYDLHYEAQDHWVCAPGSSTLKFANLRLAHLKEASAQPWGA